MSAQTSRIGGEIALSAIRLCLFATLGTFFGVVAHIAWTIVAI